MTKNHNSTVWEKVPVLEYCGIKFYSPEINFDCLDDVGDRVFRKNVPDEWHDCIAAQSAVNDVWGRLPYKVQVVLSCFDPMIKVAGNISTPKYENLVTAPDENGSISIDECLLHNLKPYGAGEYKLRKLIADAFADIYANVFSTFIATGALKNKIAKNSCPKLRLDKPLSDAQLLDVIRQPRFECNGRTHADDPTADSWAESIFSGI